MARDGLTRRDIMRYGGATVMGTAGLTLAGIGGYAWPHPAQASSATLQAGTATGRASPATAPVAQDDSGGVLHFVTRPDLTPPAITVSHHGRPAADDPPYFILSPAGYPLTGPGQPGLMILDRYGNLVWFSPNTGFPAAKGMGRDIFPLLRGGGRRKRR